jgi:hypothetical protein
VWELLADHLAIAAADREDTREVTEIPDGLKR